MKLLDGIRVVDFSCYYPGPLATLRLADWGAQVLKVESPLSDPARTMNSHEGCEGSLFRVANRGKASLIVDLKSELGREKIAEVLRMADVVIEGFRPGVVARLGIAYEDVRAIKPDIVYCSLSGYGQTGPDALRSGHDINYMAVSGALGQLRDDSGRPIKPLLPIADLVGSVAASEAILAGLVFRARTNEGVYIDVSITEAVLSLMALHATHYSLGYGEDGEFNDYLCYHIYETSDGRFITLGALEAKFWESFCDGVNRSDLVKQQKTPPVDENPYFLDMCEIFKGKCFTEWIDFSKNVDCCMSPILNIGEVLQEEGFRQRGMFGERWETSYIAMHYLNEEGFLTGEHPYPRYQSGCALFDEMVTRSGGIAWK